MASLGDAAVPSVTDGSSHHSINLLGPAPTHRLRGTITLDLRAMASRGNGGSNIASNDGSFLPRDVLSDILLRLPAKPLCRLRAVCRSWRSLLADPVFVAAHRACYPDPLFAVCVDAGSRAGNRADVNFIDTSGNVVNKISVCPSSTCHVQPHIDLVLITDPLRVLNPITGAISPLPNPEYRYRTFDKVPPWDSFVLGRATNAGGGDDGEYKVLGFRMFSLFTECKVLTLDASKAWRNAPMPPAILEQSLSGVAVSKGVAYYNVLSDNYYCSTDWLIAAFNLQEEQWRPGLLQGPVPVPLLTSYHSITYKTLAEVNGRLAAVLFGASNIDLWLLTDSGDGEQSMIWSKQCTILKSRIRASQLGRPLMRWGLPEPLWVMDDGRVVFRLLSDGDKVLRIYDPKTETYTDVLRMPNYVKAGAGLYTGNLLRVEERAHGVEEP